MPALDQWEQRLKPYFTRSLRILAEIPLTRSDIEDICAGVHASINRIGIAEATRFVTKRYPHTFLVMMAGFAAHNTAQGYWAALGAAMGVSQYELFNRGWHTTFKQEMKLRGLPYFDYEEAGNPYVTTIRFHGGIPAYSLPDFFERLLLPTVKRAALNEIPTKQALTAVLKTAYFVDSPVINFLENSGVLGEKFFDACRKMARHYLQAHGDLLPAAELGLPEYVVEAFGDFMERGADDDPSSQLRKPLLGVIPTSDRDRAWLKLPEQEIELRYAGGTLEWQVQWPGMRSPAKILCQLLRRRQDTLIKEEFFPIEATPNQVSVSLVFNDGEKEDVLRHWTLPLVPKEGRTPLLAFRSDGQQVRPGQALPAELLCLVYPLDAELRVSGKGQLSEYYGRMYGAWQGWQINTWDLTEAWSIEVHRNDQAVGQIISVAGRQPEPELFGGGLSAYGQKDTPLYVGEPPAIKIPLRAGWKAAEELGRWQIEVSPVWDAEPPVQFSGRVNEMMDQVTLEENTALVDLKTIFPSETVGTYHIKVHGPGSIRSAFRLRLWPKMLVLGLPKHLLPPEQNNQPVEFTLRLPSNAGCEVQAGAGDVQVREDLVGWKVIAGPEVLDVNLNLTWQANSRPLVRVPANIPIPRLRWALALDQNQGNLEWTSHPLQKSATALVQSSAAAIHVQAHHLGENLNRLRLELVEMDDADQPLQEAEVQKTAFSPDWLRIPLGQFNGTMQNNSQQGRFDLVFLPRREEPGYRFSLLLSPHSMDIRHVGLSQLEETTWKLSWKEDYPLKNRRFMLVAAWQPWQEPWEYKVPDQARGEFLLEDVALPATCYHIYFYVAPSWEQPRTAIPVDISPHVIGLCSPIHRLAEIESQIHQTDEEQFRALVEEVCIFEHINDLENRDQTLSRCLVPFNHLTNLRLMLGLVEWLNARKIISPSQKFLWRALYDSKKVELVFKQYKLTEPLLRRYLSHVGRGAVVYGKSALLIAERSDDPVVIHACLKQLIEKEDEILILLLLDMIEHARLSNRDAVDILALKPRWAVEKLTAMDSTPQLDRLLAAIMPRLGQEVNLPDEIFIPLIIRVLPFENQPALREKYLETLVVNGREEGFNGIMQLLQETMIRQEDAEKIITLNPHLALQMLEKAPSTPIHQRWIDWLAEKFPGAAGVIRPGAQIQTPFGIGVVDRIEDLTGKPLLQTMIRNQNVRINLLIGSGADRYRIWLNLNDDTMTFFEAQKAWQCGYCKFAHPDQRALERHYNQVHPGASRVLRGIPATVSINRAELKII